MKNQEANYKDRQYYMNECYRLRNRIKKYQLKLQELKEKQANNINITTLKETINKQRIEIYTLQRTISNLESNPTKQQERVIKKLENELELNKNLYKKDIRHLKIELTEITRERNLLKESLNMLKIKNKRILGDYFAEVNSFEETLTPLSVLVLDFQYMFIFMKLFEMHVFDYIIERQNPDNKTDEDDKELIKVCKNWTDEVIKNQTVYVSLNSARLKEAIKSFTNNYIDEREKKVI